MCSEGKVPEAMTDPKAGRWLWKSSRPDYIGSCATEVQLVPSDSDNISIYSVM